MAYEFGCDVARFELRKLDPEEGEEEQYELDALAGDLTAHIATNEAGLRELLRAIEDAAAAPEARQGGPWEPQLPVMKGFFFHPRIFLDYIEINPPMVTVEEENGERVYVETDYWELIFDDEDGSRLMLRASERAVRNLQHDLVMLLYGES